MSKTKPVSNYNPISDRQLELMNDSQLIITRNILKSDLSSGTSDPEGFIMSDYNRVCARMAERLERCYMIGCVPGGKEDPGTTSYVAELRAELAACYDQLNVLRVENRSLAFALTGVESEFEESLVVDTEPELPFYYPDDSSDDDLDDGLNTVFIV